MTEDEYNEAVKGMERQIQFNSLKANVNRARSVVVGTAFGGTTEVSLRGDDGRQLWAILQPVEVIELIHQLSANVGCHIALKPRQDFSSWRGWQVSEEEKLHLNGHPPFANDMLLSMHVGTGFEGVNHPDAAVTSINVKKKIKQQEKESLILDKPTKKTRALKNKSGNEHESVAVEKNINKRSSKRTSTPS